MKRITRGQNHHRHGVTGHLGIAQSACQLQAVHIGQPDVNNGRIKHLGLQDLFGTLATAYPVDGITRMGEPQFDAAGDHHIVFDEKQTHAGQDLSATESWCRKPDQSGFPATSNAEHGHR